MKLSKPDEDEEVSDMARPSCLYEHPRTGAKFFVASETVAQDKKLLEQHGIFNIICAKDPKSELFHEADERFTYMRFHIEGMTSKRDHLATDEQVLNFLPFLAFQQV